MVRRLLTLLIALMLTPVHAHPGPLQASAGARHWASLHRAIVPGPIASLTEPSFGSGAPLRAEHRGSATTPSAVSILRLRPGLEGSARSVRSPLVLRDGSAIIPLRL
jgi:hypothetical protein